MRRMASLTISVLLAAASVVVLPAVRVAALSVQNTMIIGTAIGGGAADGDNIGPVISSDGRYVAFTSYAHNLTFDQLPSDSLPQIFLYDRQTHVIELISKTPNGETANQGALPISVSNNGRFVLLSSTSTNLPGYSQPDPSFNGRLLYLLDRQSGSMTRIGDQAFLNVDTGAKAMSADGNLVAYEAVVGYDWNNANPQITNGRYIYNRTTGISTQLPDDCGGVLSANGRYTVCKTSDKVELYTIDTAQRREILPSFASKEPIICLNEDATRALFTTNNATNTGFDVYFANLDTGQVTAVDTNLGYSGLAYLSISADNRLVTYESRSAASNRTSKEGWIADVTTGEKLRVVQSYAFVPLTITANGSEVIYSAAPTSEDAFRQQVYVAQLGNNDTAAPTVVGTADRAANAAGWYNSEVTINWSVTDPDPSSGPPTVPPSTVAGIEAANHVYISDQSCDPAGNCATGSLTLSIDKTAPSITPRLTHAPNAAGWNNSAVTVNYDCSDALSGVQSCTAAQVESGDGIFVLEGIATDNAANMSMVDATVKIDQTVPTVGAPVWSANPLQQGSSTTVTIPATDALSGVASVQYAIEGGTPQSMTFDPASNSWKATLGGTLASNTYNISFTATDKAGNTSVPVTDILAVYNSSNGYVTGHARTLPTGTDVLPITRDTSNNPTKLVVGFTNAVAPTSGSFDLKYVVKNNQNEFGLSSTGINWVVVPDSAHASILGHADMTTYKNGTQTVIQNMSVRFDITLGANGAPGHITVKIFNPGVDPSIGMPVYTISDEVLSNGSNLMIHP